MPRSARERSESGLYHVMVRGINRDVIFVHPDDKLRYLDILAKVKGRSECRIYAYCLMNNHLHLLLGEGIEGLGETMKRLGSSYAQWFNLKYERVGHLFQDRFLSEPVESDDYLLMAIRYIHQNPVKAGLVKDCGDYVWSSYRAYALGRDHPQGLTDVTFPLEIAGGRMKLLSFHQEIGAYEFCDVEELGKASNEHILSTLKTLLSGNSLSTLSTDLRQRDEILRALKAIPGASNRQIASLLGIGRKTVDRV